MGITPHDKIHSLHCLKAIGAFFVICIHSVSSLTLTPIIRTAVPIFFIISGFFLYSENKEKALFKCKKSIIKIFWITLYSNLFYCLVNHVLYPFSSLRNILNFIFIGDNVGFQLWYLNAFLECLLIFYVCIKYNKLNYLFLLIPLLALGGLLTGSYQFVFHSLPSNLHISRNVFTMGIPCVGIGWLIRKYHTQILQKLKASVLLLLILFILAELEVILIRYNIPNPGYPGDFYMITYPLATVMVLIAIKNPSLGKNTLLNLIGEKYSLYIYIFHVLILNFIWKAGKYIEIPYLIVPILAFILSIIFTYIWKKSSIKFFLKG